MESGNIGVCYLVGAGPGAPGLLTLRGRECIEQADVIVYDYLVNPQLLRWARPDAEVVYAGKKSREHTLSQEEINALIVQRALDGKSIARLKGGDPFVLGRGGEEAEELEAAGVPFEIVPGVSSAIAAPAYAGIPVTHRSHNSVLTIFTGHEDPKKDGPIVDYAKLAAADGVLVMVMGMGRIKEITEALGAEGADPQRPVALVRWGTTGRQETLTGVLSDIAEKAMAAGFKAPTVAVFGEVVNLREKLNWFEKRPLYGRRIVVTRTQKQAGVLSRRFQDLGAEVIELPTIQIQPPKDMRSFAELVQTAHNYDWLVFTGPNGAEAFFEIFFKLYGDAREIGPARIAAIGPGTAEKIREYRFGVDLMPEHHVAEGLIGTFEKKVGSIDNLKMLWVRPEVARDVVSKKLIDKGAILDEAIAYRTVPETEDVCGGMARFRENGADIVTFTSASTVEGFHRLELPPPENLKIASIGPITSKALQTNGLYVDIEAEQHDISGLVAAVVEYFEGAGKEA